jgi:hypothetical protein
MCIKLNKSSQVTLLITRHLKTKQHAELPQVKSSQVKLLCTNSTLCIVK